MSPPQETQPESNTLTVDFSWRKFNALIRPSSTSSQKPYTVKFKPLSPHLVFKTDEAIFGTGHLNTFSINAACTLRNVPIELIAEKRLKTSYSHQSHNFSSDPKKTVKMTWTSTSDFVTWDFICLDEKQNPVAKFSANIWALKKIGRIEFSNIGEGEEAERKKEEIVVMGLTLFNTMVVRMNNIFSLWGSAFHTPGRAREKVKNVEGEGVELEEGGKIKKL